MILGVPRETHPGETRVPLLPDDIRKLTRKGAAFRVEAGLGQSIEIPDAAYAEAGAEVVTDRNALFSGSDVVLRLRKPPVEDVALLRRGAIHVSYLDPFNERDLVKALAAAGVTALSMEMIPRTTIAQKMDALSSQANLAGYAAVLLAATQCPRLLPMMMTPAGTITPARVFVIGAGVAGLQAIATARRLGARVEAFDTRPVVEEQVQSLGAKFVKIDIGETGQTKDGYARELTPEQIAKQREGMARHCAGADIVITTAALFGKRAPILVTQDMVAGMRPGSVIVDMAVESGGNVEGSRPGEDVVVHGVRILGALNLPGKVPAAASQMYSANLINLVDHFWDKEAKSLKLNLEDELLRCVITHDGAIRNEMIRKLYEGEGARA